MVCKFHFRRRLCLHCEKTALLIGPGESQILSIFRRPQRRPTPLPLRRASSSYTVSASGSRKTLVASLTVTRWLAAALARSLTGPQLIGNPAAAPVFLLVASLDPRCAMRANLMISLRRAFCYLRRPRTVPPLHPPGARRPKSLVAAARISTVVGLCGSRSSAVSSCPSWTRGLMCMPTGTCSSPIDGQLKAGMAYDQEGRWLGVQIGLPDRLGLTVPARPLPSRSAPHLARSPRRSPAPTAIASASKPNTRERSVPHSHSMVAGGLPVMS